MGEASCFGELTACFQSGFSCLKDNFAATEYICHLILKLCLHIWLGFCAVVSMHWCFMKRQPYIPPLWPWGEELYLAVKRSEKVGLQASSKQRENPFCERDFELHFIFCLPDWWAMRWMMFCSALWHCLIPRRRTLIIAGLCRLLSRGQGLSEWWRGVQEGGGGGSPSDKAWWRWAHGCGGRWRESSPMTTQLELPSRSQRRTHAERNRENTGSGPKEWWKTEKNERTYKLVLFTWMHAKGWLKVT